MFSPGFPDAARLANASRRNRTEQGREEIRRALAGAVFEPSWLHFFVFALSPLW